MTFRWVKGHSDDPCNDLVDRLAVEAARTQTGPFGRRARPTTWARPTRAGPAARSTRRAAARGRPGGGRRPPAARAGRLRRRTRRPTRCGPSWPRSWRPSASSTPTWSCSPAWAWGPSSWRPRRRPRPACPTWPCCPTPTRTRSGRRRRARRYRRLLDGARSTVVLQNKAARHQAAGRRRPAPPRRLAGPPRPRGGGRLGRRGRRRSAGPVPGAAGRPGRGRRLGRPPAGVVGRTWAHRGGNGGRIHRGSRGNSPRPCAPVRRRLLGSSMGCSRGTGPARAAVSCYGQSTDVLRHVRDVCDFHVDALLREGVSPLDKPFDARRTPQEWLARTAGESTKREFRGRAPEPVRAGRRGARRPPRLRHRQRGGHGPVRAGALDDSDRPRDSGSLAARTRRHRGRGRRPPLRAGRGPGGGPLRPPHRVRRRHCAGTTTSTSRSSWPAPRPGSTSHGSCRATSSCGRAARPVPTSCAVTWWRWSTRWRDVGLRSVRPARRPDPQGTADVAPPVPPARRLTGGVDRPVEGTTGCMTLVGYHASHEQHPPSRLLPRRHAGRGGRLRGHSSSDHFAPWNRSQGDRATCGRGWAPPCSYVGALRRGQRRRGSATTRPCWPRPSPPSARCSPDASRWPSGSGEASNEHITGDRWPDKAARNERLLECVHVIRRLLAGEEVSVDGHVRVDRAQLWTLPATPPALFGAALSVETARWCGGWADGLITVHQAPDKLRAVIEAFREGGGAGKTGPGASQGLLGAERGRGARRRPRPVADQHLRVQGHVGLGGGRPLRGGGHVRPPGGHAGLRPRSPPTRTGSAAGCRSSSPPASTSCIIHQVGKEQERFIDTFGSRALPELRPAG